MLFIAIVVVLCAAYLLWQLLEADLTEESESMTEAKPSRV